MLFKPENSRNSIYGINNITLGTQKRVNCAKLRVNCAKLLGIYIDNELITLITSARKLIVGHMHSRQSN